MADRTARRVAADEPVRETEALRAVMRKDPDRVQDLLGGMTPQELLEFSEHVEKLWHAIRRARWGGGASR